MILIVYNIGTHNKHEEQHTQKFEYHFKFINKKEVLNIIIILINLNFKKFECYILHNNLYIFEKTGM